MIRSKSLSRLLAVFLVLALTFTMSAPVFGENNNFPEGNMPGIENSQYDEDPGDLEEDPPVDPGAKPDEQREGEIIDNAEEVPLAEELTLLAGELMPGITIKRVEVLNGGAQQALWRNAERWNISRYTVYKGDDPVLGGGDHNPDRYYTTARMVNMQDPRAFFLEIVIPKGDYTGIGTEAGQFNPENVTFTYRPNNEWNPIIGSTTAGTDNLPNARTGVTAARIEGDFIVIDASVSFDGIGRTTTAEINRPYTPYYDKGRPNAAEWSRVGEWPLSVLYSGSEIASMQLRTAQSDSHKRWREMDAWAKDYIETYGPEGGTEYSEQGRYMMVESMGKSAEGRDLWAVVISDSKDSVDYHLNTTVPLMNTNPALMQSQLEDGTFNHRGVLMFNAIHGNEIQANGLLPDTRDRLLNEDTITFGVRDKDATRRVLPTSNTNSGGTRLNDGVGRGDQITTVELDVDDFLDDYIVVLLLWTNPDGNERPQRTNIFGQDPNRDGGIFAFPETIGAVKCMTKWDPIYFAEFHDDVSTFQIDGCTPPTEASLEADLIDNYMVKLLDAVGYGALGNSFTNFSIPTRDMVSDWDAGALLYSASIAMMNGSLGSTWEFPMNNQDAIDSGLSGIFNLMNYMSEERDGLYGNKLEYKLRGVENIDAKDKVDPLLTSVHWLLEEVRDQVSFTMNQAVQQPRPRLKDAAGNELSFFPEYWILPVDKSLQYSPSGVVEALTMIQELGGVEIDRTTEPVLVDGVTYPAGTYVIDMHQGRRSWAHSVLYPGFDASIYGNALYDGNTVTSWPGQKGFNAMRSWKTDAFKGKTEKVDLVKQVELPGTGQFVIYTNAGHDAVRLTNRLLNAGKDAWMVTNYIPGAALGDIVARRADVLEMVGPESNPIWGPLALNVFGIDGGNTPPDSRVATKLVKPVIATDRPSGNTLRFAYDSLEFTNNFGGTSASGPDAVFVGTAPTANSANLPQFLYNISATSLNNTNALGDGAVANKTGLSGLNEMLGKADWSASSIVAANFGLFDQLFAYNATKYQAPRSDLKVLAAFTSEDDIYLSGRKGANNASQLKGAVMAVSGIRAASGTQVTAINENIFDRDRYQAMWSLMANTIFAGAAGITDLPRPWATADKNGIDVTIDFAAQDTASVAEGVTLPIKKYKVASNPLEPVYDGGSGWLDYEGTFSIPKRTGNVYVHWYAENSLGVSNQGTFTFGGYGDSYPVVGIRTAAETVIGDPVTFIISVANVVNMMGITVEFVVSGDELVNTGDFTVPTGLKAMNDKIAWKQIPGTNRWKGSVTLVPDPVNQGITPQGRLDILQIECQSPLSVDETAAMEITAATISTWDDVANEPVYVQHIVDPNLATTTITQWYSAYDLNRDGKVDILDLVYPQQYYLADENDPEWNVRKIADVNGDGRVDLFDMMEIFVHFTE